VKVFIQIIVNSMELMQSMHVIRSLYYRPLILLFGLVFSVCAHAAAPTFSMAFSPTTVGPGGTSTLTYTINNSAEAVGATGLSFSNTLPTGMTIANPSRASTTCVHGQFTATAGASSVTFTDYRLSANATCTLTLAVTHATPGAYVNTSGALASSAGSAGTAEATLTVDSGRPDLTMAFAPSTISQGAVSTLTYTIDNNFNGSSANRLTFANTLPSGLVISGQPEASTTCTGGVVAVVAGGSTIAFSDASMTSNTSCTVSVNVTAPQAGEYTNVNGQLSQNGSVPGGKAGAVLTVINPFLNANFPASVAPGASVTLRYTLINLDRDNVATDITFTNDLNATLSGLMATALPASGFCGAGSTISGTSNITIAGANLVSGASCTFDLTVLIPSGAAAGTYTNTTSTVNLTLGSATTQSALSHSLVVKNAPLLAMEFIDDPVTLSADVTLRFTITNTDSSNSLSNLAFTQLYEVSYDGMVLKTTPNANSCGVGSTFASNSDGESNWFGMADGSLTAGANCTFDVIYTLPSSAPSGSYLHTTSAITGTLSSAAITGNIATDTLVVRAAPRLILTIDEDYVAPGGTVTAQLSMEYNENATDITDLAFTIDLNSALSGMTFTSATNSDICGVGSSISGSSSSTFTFTGGSLAASEECSFTITLQIPSGATPGVAVLLTSTVTGTAAAQSVTSGTTSDTLTVSGLTLSKVFVTTPATPGAAVTARYTIANAANAQAATEIQFTDNLHLSLSSLSATSLPSTPCGAGSTITGTTSLTLSAGNLTPGTSCTFDVILLVPSGTSAGIYNSPTSTMSATINGSNTENPSSAAVLYVDTLVTLISTSASSPTETSPIPVVIHFSRDVTNFIISDLSITNGSASNFAGSGQAYSVDITPTSFGTVLVTLPATTVDDAVFAGVQNAAQSLSIEYVDVPANVAVTVPATALNTVGVSYTVAGTHTINASRVFLYSDDDNNGVADNSTALASDTVVDGTWSLSAPLSPQVVNNFVVGWEDRVNRVNRVVNVPTITEVTPNFDPVISGTPSTSVAEDASYSFTPTMTDANTNDTHLFSITNPPSWASFDTATGALTGTPVNADVGTSSNIVITVTDSSTLTASLTAFNITVSNTNDAPVISGTPATTVVEDAAYSFTPTISEVDVGDTTTYSISNQPTWANFSASTGVLSGTPTNDDNGVDSNIVITATDSSSAADSLAAFSITVSNSNDAPVISGTPGTTVAEDAAYSFTPTASDVDSGDTATFSISNPPSWASFDTATGVLSGTPVNSDVGLTSNVVITVTDTANVADSLAAFSLTVTNTNDAPTISGTPNISVSEDAAYSFTPVVNDVDSGDTETFSISNQPAWASFSPSTGVLSGTPTNDDIGTTSNIVITVTDSASVNDSLAAFSLTVSNTNDAPVISGTPNTAVAEDAAYSFTPSVSDVDAGDTETFSISNQPSWASFDTSTGALTGTPTNSDVGVAAGIVITVEDTAGARASLASFSITVSNTNDALVISGTPSTSVNEDASYSFTPTVSDEDVGDTETFSISNPPSWTSFDTGSGVLSGTPANGDVGLSSNIVISVTDSGGAISNLTAFSITVINTNDAPVISGSPSTSVAEDASYSFTPSVSDVDIGDTTSFSIVNQPSWASFNAGTGALTGTPTNSDIGTTSLIVITVTDGASATDSLASFNVSVSNTNDAPVISGTPSTTVTEDSSYSFTPTISDDDVGDTASFSVSNLPSWASFDTSTGGLTGTPVNADVGVATNIVITVADGAGAIDSLAAFSITVANSNDAPLMSGTPSTSIAEGASYSFTPTVSDVDVGDTLAFSIVNQPSWASFDSATGILAGVPTNSDVGTTNAIVITVSDNAGATSSLSAFNLNVSNTNDAPTISGAPSNNVAEDASYSFTPSASDVDSGDSASFSISNPPSWANFNTATGALTGTPTNSDVGLSTGIVITVTDAAGATASLTTFSISVSNTNDAIVINGTPSTTVAEDASYSFTPTVSEEDSGDTALFSIMNKPIWADFNTDTGALTGTPTNDNVGVSSNVVISVTDSGGAVSSLAAFNITVSNTNDAPNISGTPNTSVAEDSSYSFTPSASDVDTGDTASFSVSNLPSWASFSASTGAITGTPTNSDVGLASGIVLTVTDAAGATDSLASFDITVSNTNDALVINGTPSTAVAEDSNYSFTPTVNDEDVGDTTSFSISNQPSWASFDTATGVLAGIPLNSDVGVSANIVISATDSGGEISSLAAFSITVSNTNDAPEINGTPDTAVDEDANYSFTPTASDVDSGDTELFGINGKPFWATFDTATGSLTGTPSNDDVGVDSNIVISVTDSAAAVTNLAAFNITVSNTNDAPLISGTPSTLVAEDANYSFVPVVSDVDGGDTTSFSISNQPTWASFSASTGALTGSPANSDVGISSGIVITVMDTAGATASLAAFSITVSNTNDALVIDGVPDTIIDEDAAYSFTPIVTDDDSGDTTVFSISNKPTWASFDIAEGTLTGTPTNSDVGESSNIIISVTDSGAAVASLPAFSITVTNTNDAPIISGTPATAIDEDAPYSFVPVLNDVDAGDTATFSINNKPTWAEFDTATGALTSTPLNADVGVHSDIEITVTDTAGALSNLTAFSITVSNTNDAPVISGTPNTTVVEDTNYSFTPTVVDVDEGDTATFTITNKPTWATFDSTTGALTGVPTNFNVGITRNIVITVSDTDTVMASLAGFNLTVINSNDAPVISGSPSTTVEEDVLYSFTPIVSDADVGDSITFSATGMPTWASLNTMTGALTGTPSNNDVGQSAAIVITASDSVGGTASLAAFNITVSNTNDAPVISGAPATSVDEDMAYSFSPVVTDVDVGDTATFSITNKPDWATFDSVSGILAGTPGSGDVDVYGSISISVSDTAGATDSLAVFSISVSNINDAPVISGTPSTTALEDIAYSFTPIVTDPDDADVKVFTIVNLPEWLTFNPSNGNLSGTPGDDDVGTTTDIVISVADIVEASDSLPVFSITVINVNDVPVAVDDNYLLSRDANGYLLDVLQNDTDDDGDILSIVSINTALDGMSIENGQLRFAPDFEFDIVEFEYLISDGNGAQDIALVTLEIEAGNTGGPTITVPDDIEINATGIRTRVNLGIATAVDANGNALLVTRLDAITRFKAGVHIIYWQATDANGNTVVDEQEIRINPLIAFINGQKTIEGSTVRVEVLLSGEAFEYPVIVNYQVSGTADEGDHNLVDGELRLVTTKGVIEFDVYEDGVFEEPETIILTLSGELNHLNQNTHTVDIVDGNVAPSVTLQVIQDDEPRSIIDQDGGIVVVTATVTDSNPADSHILSWQPIEGLVDLDSSDETLTFDPAMLVPDQYSISITVTDDGNPIETDSSTTFFSVTNIIPDLSSEDSDGDLVPDDIEGIGDDDGDGIPNYLDNSSVNINVVPSNTAEQDKFLVEGPAGSSVRIGQFSAGSENGGALLTEDDVSTQLAVDDEAENVGGVFDFIIDDLSTVGASYSVVLPQTEAIPNFAFYRKYVGGNWVNFVIDDKNSVSSAEGESGYCPPPEADEWQLGLAEGHWCVQLSIEDGGPNDDDGEANGTIVDPGGVAVLITSNHAPIVLDDEITTNTTIALAVNVLSNDTDEDGDTLIVSSANANIGVSEVSEFGLLTYTPVAGYVGRDTIIYSVSDGNGGTAQGTLVINIIAPDLDATNPNPVAPRGNRTSSGSGSMDWLMMLFVCLIGFGRFVGENSRRN
jgi:VCBS repeat-containing protein